MHLKHKSINRYDNSVCVLATLRCRYVDHRASNGNDGHGWNGNNIAALTMCTVPAF